MTSSLVGSEMCIRDRISMMEMRERRSSSNNMSFLRQSLGIMMINGGEPGHENKPGDDPDDDDDHDDDQDEPE
eukprot:3613796-Prorocentrum_lima.AAC.1